MTNDPWEDIDGVSNTGPFGVGPVDGLVYAEHTDSPELRLPADTGQPDLALPQRSAPARPRPQSVTAWQPGSPVDPAAYARTAASAGRATIRHLVAGLLPVLLVAIALLAVVRAHLL
jgi:hypothetical protein